MSKIVLFAAILSFGMTSTAFAHSGGGSKSSPAGMCCHAGSQPYHCH